MKVQFELVAYSYFLIINFAVVAAVVVVEDLNLV